MENEVLVRRQFSDLKDKKKYKEINELCDTYLKNEPDNLWLLKRKADALFEIGKVPAFRLLLDCLGKIHEQSEEIEYLVLEVKVLRRLKKHDEAKKILEIAEKLEPKNPDVLQQKSSLLIDKKRYDEAKKVLKQLEEIDPAKTWVNAGVIAKNEKKYDHALQCYSLRLEGEQHNFPAAKNKAWLLFEMVRYDEAISLMKEFIEKFGETQFRMYRELGALYYRIAMKYQLTSGDEYDNQPCRFGERILDESDEKWNDEKFRNTRKVSEYLRKAWKVYEEIHEKEIPHNSVSRYWKLRTWFALEGTVDSKLGDEAIGEFEQHGDDEEIFDLKTQYAGYLKRQGKFREAIEKCDEILKDFPEDTSAIAIKTDACFWAGDRLEYERLFRKYQTVRKELTFLGLPKKGDGENLPYSEEEYYSAILNEFKEWSSRGPKDYPIDRTTWINYIRLFRDGEKLVDIAQSVWNKEVGPDIGKQYSDKSKSSHMVPVVEKKTETKLKKDEKKIVREISIHPEREEELENMFKIEEFFESNCKGDVKLLDRYFSHDWFHHIAHGLAKNDSVRDIQILAGFSTLVTTTEGSPFERLYKWHDALKRFRKSNMILKSKDSNKEKKFPATLKISKKLNNVHDRFLISNKNLWNIASSDAISRNSRVDFQILDSQEDVRKDIDRFEELWNDEENFVILGSDKEMRSDGWKIFEEDLELRWIDYLEKLEREAHETKDEYFQKKALDDDLED